ELDDSTLGNRHIGAWLIGIAPDPRLANLDFEDSEIAEFDFPPLRHGFGNVIKGFLQDIQHLLLDNARFGADPHDEVSFGHKFWSFRFSAISESTLRV